MGKLKISDLEGPFVIADIGSNWKTSNDQSDNLIMAKRHIHDAAEAGVSAVKFQLFTDRELYGMDGPNQWSLPREWLPELASYAAQHSLEFMCSAFSKEGYREVDQFVNLHKVASAEMKAFPLYDWLDKPVLISTGGAHASEVAALADLLAGDQILPGKEPGIDFAFLECVASYPAEPKDYNLRVIEDPAGWMYCGVSDHTKNDVVALTAVGLGARVFEKHFSTFDRAFGDFPSTPDYPVSIGPVAMAEYVSKLKQAFAALGDGRKMARPSELSMTMRWRRRLKVTEPVKKGDGLFYGKNFGIFRSIKEDPAAFGPESFRMFDNGTAKCDLAPGDPVWHETVEPGK